MTLVITGSGRGIGAATAQLAARQGRPVCVNYLADAASADAVVRTINESGGRALAVRADVSRPDEVERLFDVAATAFGPVLALVNNAGVPGRIGRVEALDDAVLRRTFEVNVYAAFYTARAFAKWAFSRDRGRHDWRHALGRRHDYVVCRDAGGSAANGHWILEALQYPSNIRPKRERALHRCKARQIGSSTWARTRDLRINSPALYRLSYRGIQP